MIKLTLLLFVGTIGTGYLQEISSSFYPPKVGSDNAESHIWPLQNYQVRGRRAKPCPRRYNRNGVEEQWIPSFTSRISHPLYETTVLQPEALKNEEFKMQPDANKIENDLQSSQNRRSFDSVHDKSFDLKDEDCDDHLRLANETSLSTANAEETAIEIIKDCLKEQQNTNANKQIGLGNSRRSMSEPDDTDFYNYSRDLDPSESDFLENERNNNYPLDLDINNIHDAPPERSQNHLEAQYANKLTTKLMDPEISTGIANRRALDSLPKNARICYACSTATNPSCWEPNKLTTVKYCTKEQSCIIKSFGVKNSLTTIRDCANSCDDSTVPGIEPKYKSCKLCHSDYCNGAFSIGSFNLGIMLVISIVKCTLSFYQNVQ